MAGRAGAAAVPGAAPGNGIGPAGASPLSLVEASAEEVKVGRASPRGSEGGLGGSVGAFGGSVGLGVGEETAGALKAAVTLSVVAAGVASFAGEILVFPVFTCGSSWKGNDG